VTEEELQQLPGSTRSDTRIFQNNAHSGQLAELFALEATKVPSKCALWAVYIRYVLLLKSAGL
jgi:hypothetical protein